MALESGTKLGHFAITERIGAGGMGEVYRATDTRLGRDVAIKTLPETLVGDSDRLARFEREAKLLAAMNHAHIASVYSLDEHDGAQYIAMELVEGQTLEDKLEAGPLPVDDALELGLQIAMALEAAHEKGVVHRDLKPANIMITPDGVVKVLDFGLAKAFAGDPGEASPAHSPALSLAMTQQGLMLGTAGYMSPEQASAQATDQRADIWSFGVVLYEMLTGQSAFGGESVPHVLAAVLQTEPDWGRLPVDLNPRVKRVLERCLEKKPRNRLHAIADARIEIEIALREGDSWERPAVLSGRPGYRSIAIRAASTAVLLVLAAAAGWLSRGSETANQSVRRFEFVLPPGQSFPGTIPQRALPSLGISSDGNSVVYAASEQLYVWQLSAENLESVAIDGVDETVTLPLISPDGQWVAYYSDRDQLIKKIPIGGGVPVPLAESLVPTGASWSTAGILYGQQDGIYLVSADGGDARMVITTDDDEIPAYPQLLPDGDSVLFSLRSAESTEGWDSAEILVASLTSNDKTELGVQGSGARYVPTGHLIYLVGTELFAAPFDVDSLEVLSGRLVVVSGLDRQGGTGRYTSDNYGFSDRGDLIFRLGSQAAAEKLLMRVDRSGNFEPLSDARRDYDLPRISPDGTRVVVQARDPATGEPRLRMIDLASGAGSPLTLAAGTVRPNWSFDGESIVYRVEDQDSSAIMMLPVDRSREPDMLYQGVDLWPTSISPDGVIAFYEVDRPNNDRDIWTFDIESREASEFLATQYNERNPRFSPDGRWIAYVSDELGFDQIWARPAPQIGGSQRVLVAEEGGIEPAWAPDGSAIYYRDPNGYLVERVVSDTEALTLLPPVRLFSLDPQFAIDPTVTWTSFDVLPDGDFLMVSSPERAYGSQRIVYVENWFEELESRVPAP